MSSSRLVPVPGPNRYDMPALCRLLAMKHRKSRTVSGCTAVCVSGDISLSFLGHTDPQAAFADFESIVASPPVFRCRGAAGLGLQAGIQPCPR